MASFTTAQHQRMEFATYSMAEDSYHQVGSSQSNSKRKHRRGAFPTSEDDNGSLTYSDGTSINSGCSSTAGESTDSSFADIMKVLALQDGPELEALMKREGIDARALAKAKQKALGDTMSVTSSLNYSTDGESALNGEHCIQTITGQPSDSYGPDGGGIGLKSSAIVFAPADPVDRKRRRYKKSSSSRSTLSSSSRSPQMEKKAFTSHQKKYYNDVEINDSRESSDNTSSEENSSPQRSSSEGKSSSQRSSGSSSQRSSRGRRKTEVVKEDDSLWYPNWWMCGFTDTFLDFVHKRR